MSAARVERRDRAASLTAGWRSALGHPVELGQDPLGRGAVAELEQVGQAQDAAVEFGLWFAGPLGRGDDLVGRGERVRGVLGTPQDVVPGGQRGGEGRGGGVRRVRIAG